MKRRSTGAAVLIVMAAAGWTWGDDAPLRFTADRPVDLQHLKLELDVFPADKRIAGTATLDFKPLRPIRSLVLNAVGHEILAVRSENAAGKDRAALKYEYSGEELTIQFPATIPRGELHRVAIEYRVREPKAGLHFFQPTDADPKIPLMVWSQGEPITNRYWFPCCDHPNERQSTELIATVETGLEVLSNGSLVSREALPDGKKMRFHWKQEQSHAAYLVTLVVGKFTIAKEDWRGRPVLFYVPPDRAADTQATFGRTREMLDYFSDRFGIEYPWAKYAQIVVEQFVAGGMENTSATTLYDQVLHDKRALLDDSPDWIIAHELGHQWWGDLVTCKDWANLWLNEGFATYCEILWAEHKLGREERDLRLYEKARLARGGTTRTRPVVDRHYDDPGSLFDERAYPKGAWVLHMLRSRLGDDDFFELLKRYGVGFAFNTVETSDLRQVAEHLTGRSLERFFYDWTDRPGHPVLHVATSHVPDDKLVKIVLRQDHKGGPFELPVKLELVCPDHPPVPVSTLLNETERTLFVPVPVRPELIRVDPDFTLLAEIHEDKADDWWKKQAQAAPTVAERLRAIEHFADSQQPADRELLIQVLTTDRFHGVRSEAAKALGQTGGPAARDALVAGLGQTEPKVRRACADALAKFPDDKSVEQALTAAIARGDASYFVEAAVLGALAKVQHPVAAAPFLAALKQDSHADVIRQAALRGLALCDGAEPFEVLMQRTKRGHSRNARREAIRGLATHLLRSDAPPARTVQAVELCTTFLQGEVSAIRSAAIESLRDLGKSARPSLELLTALAAHDPDRRVRTAARAAVERMQTETPPAEELLRLRTQVDELRKKNESLETRLLKIEAR